MGKQKNNIIKRETFHTQRERKREERNIRPTTQLMSIISCLVTRLLFLKVFPELVEPDDSSPPTVNEKKMAQIMSSHWVNFAHFGNPMKPESSESVPGTLEDLSPWPMYSSTPRKIRLFNTDPVRSAKLIYNFCIIGSKENYLPCRYLYVYPNGKGVVMREGPLPPPQTDSHSPQINIVHYSRCCQGKIFPLYLTLNVP